jgi:hypothetical protein
MSHIATMSSHRIDPPISQAFSPAGLSSKYSATHAKNETTEQKIVKNTAPP